MHFMNKDGNCTAPSLAGARQRTRFMRYFDLIKRETREVDQEGNPSVMLMFWRS